MAPVIDVATVQFAPRKGEYETNLAHLGELFAQLDALTPRPQVLHLPETALTGYFLEGGVREFALTAGAQAADLQRVYRNAVPQAADRTLEIVLGFYEVWNNTLYNSAMWVRVGGAAPLVRHVHRKNFLPTYGLFDEERFVERGQSFSAFDTPWGRCAVLICEDSWHSLTGTLLALDGARAIFICSAAPARGPWPRDDGIPGPSSVARWERLVRDIAEEHGVFVSFSNLASSEAGKSFPGGALVAGPKGDVRIRGPMWTEAVLPIAMDLGDLTRARADMPLLADLRVALPHLVESLGKIQSGRSEAPAYDTEDGEARAVRERPASLGTVRARSVAVVDGGMAAAGTPPPLEIDAALVEEWLATFLRDEIAGRGFHKGIVALSGGVDSAVTAFLATRALGADNVIGVRLPYRASSPDSLAHAQLVIEALGIEGRTLDISGTVDGYLGHEPGADATRRGNVMARARMIALFDLSARYAAIPLGTGNKTERLLGYFTWHADDSPPLNPLGDLYKTQVWDLARHLGVPAEIIDKAPTADLVSGQTDEGDLGIAYAKADQILHWLLHGYAPAELESRGFVREEVELVRRRLERTHWKRRLPTVAILSSTAIGESWLRPVDY